MPTPDQTRIMADRAAPRPMQLWWAMAPLRSTVRFMMSGAHPDDEISDMLAALAFRDGVNLSYACSTRGEGGQNDIGRESGAALGALRTREMERACDVLGMRMYWLSDGPDDPVTDFGFSKSGEETLARWGAEKTLQRFVEAVRTDRPDVLCPTFLDVPGQHGHHRAMTQAAHQVMAAAADPGFASNLPPWQISKLYLPAWSGAGQAYDDDEPPPPATMTVPGMDREPLTGWSWARIGQQSRAYHRTQGMGRWVPAGDPGRDWPLHLVEAHVSGPDDRVVAGLPARLRDVGAALGGDAAPLLAQADVAIDAAFAAYPNGEAVGQAALEALEAVYYASRGLTDAQDLAHGHRLAAKQDQLGHVMRLALGVECSARVEEVWTSPGRSQRLHLEGGPGLADDLLFSEALPEGWVHAREDHQLTLSAEATPSDPYPMHYDPLLPPAPALDLEIELAGLRAACRLPFEVAPVVLPPRAATVTPSAAIVNRAREQNRIAARFDDLSPVGATPALEVPEGWAATADGGAMEVDPGDAAPGLYTLPVTLDGQPAATVTRIAYDHVAPTALATPAVLRVRVLDVAVPEARVGYIGSGNDRVDHWLGEIGADVTALSDAALADPASLAAYDTLVVGIFALRFRPGLAEAMPAINAWVEAGGTLLTLYHRPWDNWDPDRIPPRRLEIGQPSLRWRVTDEAAEVTVLADHDLLRGPNPIGPQDWQGWVKERGLYFAKSWDAAYTPLLSMADPGEAPLTGALLVGEIGQGRHIHTSLILHHQMEHLVPGAFRLMANLITPRR